MRCSREVVVDEEADLPHAVGQKAEIPPALVLLPAPIREYVYPGRVTVVPGDSCCLTSFSVQIVVCHPGETVQVEIPIVLHVLRGKYPRLCHVHPPTPRMRLRTETHDSHHERHLRVDGHHHADDWWVYFSAKSVSMTRSPSLNVSKHRP